MEQAITARTQDRYIDSFSKLVPGRVPDPFQPIHLDRWAVGAGGGKRLQNQREKKAQIMATARRLLAEHGMEGVSVRDIAEQCGISAPTIYHIAGQRMELLEESASEWVRVLAWAAPVTFPYPNQTLSILLAFWNSTCDHPAYTTRAVPSACAPDAPLNQAFLSMGIRLIRRSLENQALRGLIRSGADLDLLARRLGLAVHADACSFALNRTNPVGYRRAFAYGPGLMLLGALAGDDAEVVERTLQEIAHV